MYRKVTRRFQITIPEDWRKKYRVKEGDKLISFENERGQLVVVTLEQALDKWEENTRDLGSTIKEFREGFKKRGERLR
ncbi:MAG: AbrB/MazE/SpoVT family DNA-binding domain-containing protein [Methanobacteriota archaeon]